MPKVSILVPVYGVEKYIERCARSLFEQSADDFEFIFVDDCSPDKSIAILTDVLSDFPHWKNKTTIIRHEHNMGSAATRLSGLNHATGEYVIYCDSDDWIEPQMYSMLYDVAKRDDADVVICDYYVNTNKKQIHVKQSVCCSHTEVVKQIIRGDIHNGLCNKLIRKELYEKISPTFTIGLNMWEDVSVLSRLAYYSCQFSYIPTPLYHYAQINGQGYTRFWKPIYTSNIIEAITINDMFFDNKNIDVTPLWIRGFYSILTHTKRSERHKYLDYFQQNSHVSKIDYSIFSASNNKIIARLIFNRYDVMADIFMFIKRILRKFL